MFNYLQNPIISINYTMFQLRLTALLAILAVFAHFVSAAQLQIGILKKAPNCERKAQNNDSLHVHYSGKLAENGKVFDDSYSRGQPINFKLGTGTVIKGWDLGILGMCVGEKRKVTIPSHLAYGSRGAGDVIPPDADLIFTLELVRIDGYEAPIVELDEEVEKSSEEAEKDEL